MKHLSIETIREAQERIRPYVVRTPLLRHRLSEACELLLKPESLQPTGAFKLRGAFNLMCTLPRDCRGVVAHSSGNHAQAVAYAARQLGIPAVVVMPDDAPALKRERTQAYGAEVVIVGPDSAERAQRASELAEQRGLVDAYVQIAQSRFEADEFYEFCDKHLGHLDEVAHEFFGGETVRDAIRQKVESLFPAHEIEEFTELFWIRVQAWRNDESNQHP